MPRSGTTNTGGGSQRAITPRDSEITEVVTAFLREMPGRIGRFESLWTQQRFDELLRAARDLALVGAGVGFSEVAYAAGTLGRRLMDLGNGRSAGGELETLRREFWAVVEACRGMIGTSEAGHA